MSVDRPGANVLVLRPQPEAAETAADVARLGWRPVVSPLLAIEPVTAGAPPDFDALIVSSPRAVPHVPDGPAFVVGERTAAAIRARGHAVLGVAPDGRRLADAIRERGWIGRLLHVCGDEVAFDFAACLPDVSRHVVYRAVPQPLGAEARRVLHGGRATALLTSPRIARALLAEGGQVRALALSPAVAEAWGEASRGGAAEVAAEPRMDALLALLGPFENGRKP